MTSITQCQDCSRFLAECQPVIATCTASDVPLLAMTVLLGIAKAVALRRLALLFQKPAEMTAVVLPAFLLWRVSLLEPCRGLRCRFDLA